MNAKNCKTHNTVCKDLNVNKMLSITLAFNYYWRNKFNLALNLIGLYFDFLMIRIC